MGSRILVINDDKSRMSREAHVRIRGSRGPKRPRLPAKRWGDGLPRAWRYGRCSQNRADGEVPG